MTSSHDYRLAKRVPNGSALGFALSSLPDTLVFG